jgi:membrane protease YdiL (CAAX protease family)
VTFYFLDFAVFTSIALLWARWARLDLGFRRPAYRAAEPWALMFILWLTAEWALALILPFEVDPDWLAELEQFSLLDELIVVVVLAPVCEELLFRGAMFSALLRRWGIRTAAIVPSLIWAIIHIQYEWWFVASIAGSGVLLALVRWKGGSIYLPIALHAAYNLLVTLYNRGLLGNEI